jgi:DNA-binding IclR family transcriptional regulator
MSKTERALLILERIASDGPAPTHAELMRELGVQRSTLSDSLADLRALGYIAVRERRYLPGARLLTFVRGAAAHGDLSAGIRPTLESLAAETGETAIYVMEDGGHGQTPGKIVAVDQVESAHPIRYVGDVGVPYPIHTTAAGHAFLAFTDRSAHAIAAADADGLDADALDAELIAVRERGYALVFGRGDTGRATAIAAPVRDARGTPIGVISIVGPADRIASAMASIWPLLRRATEQLGQPELDV